MLLLIVGLLLFASAHLFPALAPAARERLVGRLGFNPYRGLFSLTIVASLVLVVLGWKTTTPATVYAPPFAGGPIISLVMFLAFVLFVASQTRTRLRRVVRHPQMMSVILWSITHLLVNGDVRSVALFGGLGTWAVLEMIFCNRRDGPWKKPEPSSPVVDAVTVAIGAIAFALVWYFHEALFGVLPYWRQ